MEIVDVHVHTFPPRVFAALWRWFEKNAWTVRYQLEAEEVVRFLLSRGVSRVVLLQYPHVPGLARVLNAFVSSLAAAEPRAIPFCSVLPGEEGAKEILDEALGKLGCKGIKIHCHVQKIAPDDPRLDLVYDAAAAHGVPVLIHSGDAPASHAYGCDVEALCTPEAMSRALSRHPRTDMIVPHLGAARIEEMAALLDRHEHLYLDTTMAIAGFLPPGASFQERAFEVVRRHASRILYGSDFPNIPYEWDTELKVLRALGLGEVELEGILSGNAKRLLRL